MVPVILDTNILVAALINQRGLNREALRVIIGHPDAFEICYSSQIFAEYQDVLARPVITGRGLMRNAERLLALIERIGVEIVPKYHPAVVYPDPEDRPFLEAAAYTNGVLLTNNLKHDPFLGVNILGPEEFLAWWNEREG